MKKWMHKVEVIVDKSIPWIILLLLFIIIIEFFYYETVEKYHKVVDISDGFIVFIFILDLIFKYIRIKNIPKFFKKSWPDIIAVFPFFLLFRLTEGFFKILGLEEIILGQRIFHEGLELEKEGAKIVEEVEKAGKISRTRFFVRMLKPRFLRPLIRAPRLVKIIPFFEKPTGNHYHHEKKRRRKEK